MSSIYTDIQFGENAQKPMMEGARKLAEAVGSTLGPLGKNVAIAYINQYGDVFMRHVVHDGVTVAKSISLENEIEDMGAQLIKQASQKQVQEVGDGTTVSIILAYALLFEINKLLAANMNPMKLRYAIEEAISNVIEEIEKSAIPVETFDQKKHIATVSAQNPELGEMVAKVIEEMGTNGLVDVQESKNATTTVEKQEGMQFDKGWINELFMTNPDRNEAILEDPYILVTDRSIHSMVPLKHILEHCSKAGKKLFIMTPHIAQEPLSAMLTNKLGGALANLVVQAPSFGKNQKNILQDIAIFTGARFISEDAAHKFEDFTPEELGRARYITATKTETMIVDGKGTSEDIKMRISEIEKAIENEDQEFDREKMRERLARLTTGVSVIKVGGATEVEMKERIERVKDAVAATKAAVKKGIVPGGETVYLSAREVLDTNSVDEVTRVANQLVYRALFEPFRKLLGNAALDAGEFQTLLKSAPVENKGVDVMTGKIKDMVKAGIVDPVLVPINALVNASSVAIQIATTGTTVIQRISKKEA